MLLHLTAFLFSLYFQPSRLSRCRLMSYKLIIHQAQVSFSRASYGGSSRSASSTTRRDHQRMEMNKIIKIDSKK